MNIKDKFYFHIKIQQKYIDFYTRTHTIIKLTTVCQFLTFLLMCNLYYNDKTILTHYLLLKSTYYLWVRDFGALCGYGKFILAFINCYNVKQNTFHEKEVPCTPNINASISSIAPSKFPIFKLPPNFCIFNKAMELETCNVYLHIKFFQLAFKMNPCLLVTNMLS